jgi:integrase
MPRQRSAHEGSIRQRPNGLWEARLNGGYVNGKRVQQSFYGPTRADVAEQLVKATREKQQGLTIAPSKQTVRDYLRAYLETAKPRLRARTFLGYQQTLDLHVIPQLGTLRLSKLTPQRLQTWLGALRADGVSANRCRYARTVLRAALKQAVRWQVLAVNPATLVEVPRHVKAPIVPLDVKQARQLLDAVRGHELDGFVTVGVASGLRVGEALALEWSAVDLNAGTLNVRRTVSRLPVVRDEEGQQIGGGLEYGEPKSARSRRTLTLPAVVIDALKAHRARQLEQRMALGPAWTDSGLVLTSPIGTALDYSNLRRAFRALLKAAELPMMKIHNMRHTAATLLLAQGCDPRTIMELLGHSQISLTMNTYAHVLPQLTQDAARRMDAVLARA